MIMAGRRNIRAEFQEKIETKDESGESIETWQRVYSALVRVQSVGIDSQDEDVSTLQKTALELTAQYTPTLERLITTNNRVLMRNKVYEIVNVSNTFSRKSISYTVELYE